MFETRVTALLDLLQVVRRNQSNHYAILISFRQMAASDRITAILTDFHKRGTEMARKLGGELIQVSPTDFAVLSEASDYQILGTVPELKMLLLRLIRTHLPDSFAVIDQARLVRLFNLQRDRAPLRRVLEAYLQPPEAEDHGPQGARRLTETDIQQVVRVCRDGGFRQFASHYLRSQPIAVIYGNYRPEVALREHFVGMERIHREILPDVNLHVDRNMFNVLTVELDKLLLEAVQRGCVDARFATVNLNVDTVFTRAFELAAEAGKLKNIVFEFRATDILDNLDKFDVAQRAIAALGARSAVDNVLPRMLRFLRPGNMGAAFVKVFFDLDSDSEDAETMEAIRDIGAKGARTIFARIEDEYRLKAGQRLGVELFQGFYVDRLLHEQSAREKILVA